jgi:hypothetical protein
MSHEVAEQERIAVPHKPAQHGSGLVHDPAFSREEPIGGRQRLRPLRLPHVLRFLERHFDCECRQGKGSEIVAYRSGHSMFRFGAHRSNPIVPLERLSAALTRLGITRREWCSAVYGEV